MAKGISLSIGLNRVNPEHYQGWQGSLAACENDARDMAEIAKASGFSRTTVLLTRDAKRSSVLDELANAAADLEPGDLFLLTYSGHGGQLPDMNDDEMDSQDETWCLYDAQLIDDEIYEALGKFKAGVRIFALSDSCHSGTVVKADPSGGEILRTTSAEPVRIFAAVREMPVDAMQHTYTSNRAFYDPLLSATNGEALINVQASCILISGCQDNQLSSDGVFNGLFTAHLLRTWNGGKFNKSYRDFHQAIVARMPSIQTPNFYTIGPKDADFEAMVPFRI